MRMKSIIYTFALPLVLAFNANPCFAQSNNIPWYSFNMGYGMPHSASMKVHSIIGQQFVGQTGDGGIRIQSGFIMGIQIITSVGISDGLIELPFDYSLNQNYPNPFNPETTIKYGLPQSGDVSLIIYNITGHEVIRLVNNNQLGGTHTVTWDASNFSSGIYFYRLQVGDYIETKKMVLLK